MKSAQSNLCADVIIEILKHLGVRDLLSALLINRQWCQVAIPMYWRAPFSYAKKRGMAALKTYELFLEQKMPKDSAQGAVQKFPGLYNYPSFLKELNYTNLLMLVGMRRSIPEIFQMLANVGVCLDTFIMDNNGVNYEIWTAASCYAQIFDSLTYIEIHMPFPKNNIMKILTKNCTRLSHLDINLYDNSNERVEETLDCLKKLISTQRCFMNLRLVFINGPGKRLIEMLQSRPESFKRLELVKWNFDECDWGWLKKCSNLSEFAITSPPRILISDILGTDYATHNLRPSKNNRNSRVTTAHWYLDDDDDEIISTPYFHSDKSSVVYNRSPPVVIQSRVTQPPSNYSEILQILRKYNELSSSLN
nr:13440_t:CDS:2 [Entrophospora candida]